MVQLLKANHLSVLAICWRFIDKAEQKYGFQIFGFTRF